MDSKTFTQIMAQRHQKAHEREEKAKAWAAEVTERLMSQRSKFILEFTTDEKRIFGVFDESL